MIRFISFIILISCSFQGHLKAGSKTEIVQLPDTVNVHVIGIDADARFDPVVININPGDVIRFVIREGVHTVTAYHPANRRPKRIPDTASPFDSGPLKAGEVWYLEIDKAGVFDYFCLPHERMGHAGRIISGTPNLPVSYPREGIPELVLNRIESKNEI